MENVTLGLNDRTVQVTMNCDNCLPYQAYTGLLTQNETEQPEVTELENSYPDPIVWVRQDVGSYYCEGEFGEQRTIIDNFPTDKMYLKVDDGVLIQMKASSNRIYLWVYDEEFNNIELSTLSWFIVSFRTYPQVD